MSRAALLDQARAFAVSEWTDTCTITRAVAASTDKTTGATVPTTTLTIYTGICRLQQPPDQAATGTDQGEAYRLMTRRGLQLPVVESADVRPDDIVTMTACAKDPAAVGQVFTVRDDASKSEASTRRLGVQAATS